MHTEIFKYFESVQSFMGKWAALKRSFGAFCFWQVWWNFLYSIMGNVHSFSPISMNRLKKTNSPVHLYNHTMSRIHNSIIKAPNNDVKGGCLTCLK